VNHARIDSAIRAKRRNQPRTVEGGTPTIVAARRWPAPVALATTAAPITSTRSRRRSSVSVPISTCVTAQPTQRLRRGRRRSSPPDQRTTRHRADPHGRSRPPQSGHPSSPATNARSTSALSVSTIFNSASGHQEGPSRHRQSESGRVLARAGHPHADPQRKQGATRRPPHPPSPPPMSLQHPPVLNQRGAQHCAASARTESSTPTHPPHPTGARDARPVTAGP
jgi:hypothetical protein